MPIIHDTFDPDNPPKVVEIADEDDDTVLWLAWTGYAEAIEVALDRGLFSDVLTEVFQGMLDYMREHDLEVMPRGEGG